MFKRLIAAGVLLEAAMAAAIFSGVTFPRLDGGESASSTLPLPSSPTPQLVPAPVPMDQVLITEWVDGDTFHGTWTTTTSSCQTIRVPWKPSAPIAIELTAMIAIPVIVRCDGLNAPELHGPTAAAGHASKVYAEKLAPAGTTVSLVTAGDGQEKYGRWLATVILVDGRLFAGEMIHAHRAVEYHGGTR